MSEADQSALASERPRPGRSQKSGEGWFARHWLKLVLSLGVAIGFAYLMHAGALPILPGAEAFQRVRWWTVPTYALLWSGVHFIRAGRWYFLLAPVHRVP